MTSATINTVIKDRKIQLEGVDTNRARLFVEMADVVPTKVLSLDEVEESTKATYIEEHMEQFYVHAMTTAPTYLTWSGAFYSLRTLYSMGVIDDQTYQRGEYLLGIIWDKSESNSWALAEQIRSQLYMAVAERRLLAADVRKYQDLQRGADVEDPDYGYYDTDLAIAEARYEGGQKLVETLAKILINSDLKQELA